MIVIFFLGQWAVGAGWGLVSNYVPTYCKYLESLWTHIIENYNSECDKEFGNRIKDTNICTLRGNICEGDFGGPLILPSKKFLIGIASFTHENCGLGAPNVFTNVMEYSSWISANSDVIFDN